MTRHTMLRCAFAALALTALAVSIHADVSIEWRELPPLPEPLGLGGPFAGVSNDALIVASGEGRPGVRSPKVWAVRLGREK